MRTVPKPQHCGECNPRTRILETDEDHPRRCPDCHPLEAPAPASGGWHGADQPDTLWMRRVRVAIAQLAAEGRPFAAEDVATLGVGEPANPNHWGVAFQAARRAGLISQVGISQSPRAARRGGLRRTWIGRTA